jgi:hypothetical protein
MSYTKVVLRRGNLSREISACMGVSRTQITVASSHTILQVSVRNGMTLDIAAMDLSLYRAGQEIS